MLSNPFILYVEDEPMSRKVLELLLTRGLGYTKVCLFENSEDFMARVEALPQRPDLVFLDIHMRPSNGFEMLHMLRQHPDYRQIMVIALTASVMNEEVQLLKASGFNGAISKPIDQIVFPRLLERILSGEEVWNIV
jgi:CheY-like chemotaxis protein